MNYTPKDKKDHVIGGYGGRYFKHGDVVTQKDFIPFVFDELVESGDLVPLGSDISDAEILDETNEMDESEELTKDQIVEKLESYVLEGHEIDFKKSMSKANLKGILDEFETKLIEIDTESENELDLDLGDLTEEE